MRFCSRWRNRLPQVMLSHSLKLSLTMPCLLSCLSYFFTSNFLLGRPYIARMLYFLLFIPEISTLLFVLWLHWDYLALLVLHSPVYLLGVILVLDLPVQMCLLLWLYCMIFLCSNLRLTAFGSIKYPWLGLVSTSISCGCGPPIFWVVAGDTSLADILYTRNFSTGSSLLVLDTAVGIYKWMFDCRQSGVLRILTYVCSAVRCYAGEEDCV